MFIRRGHPLSSLGVLRLLPLQEGNYLEYEWAFYAICQRLEGTTTDALTSGFGQIRCCSCIRECAYKTNDKLFSPKILNNVLKCK